LLTSTLLQPFGTQCIAELLPKALKLAPQILLRRAAGRMRGVESGLCPVLLAHQLGGF
jgi:hypothetical protein